MMKQEDIKLKQCPFCGSDAYSQVGYIGNNCATQYLKLTIRCNKSGCNAEKSKIIELNDFNSLLTELNRFVDGWNARS